MVRRMAAMARASVREGGICTKSLILWKDCVIHFSCGRMNGSNTTVVGGVKIDPTDTLAVV